MLKEGFNKDIDNNDYHADREYISSSGLKMLLKDPREFEKRYVLEEHSDNKSSASMDFGSYVHSLILEPHLVEKEYAVYEGAVRRGKAYDDFVAANEGKKVIMQSQFLEAQRAIELFNSAKVYTKNSKGEDVLANVSDFFTKGEAEETLCGEIDGVKIKVRFDYRKVKGIIASINDIKTTQYPIETKSDIESVSANWDYQLSAALYADMAEKYTGIKHDFYFCYINTKTSTVQLVKASEQMLEEGRNQYKQAIKLLKKARTGGEYYPKGVMEIDYVTK